MGFEGSQRTHHPHNLFASVLKDSSFDAALAHMRASLFIPFTMIGGFAAAQLMLGTNPAIVAMCAAAVAVPFLPLGLYGRDLYSLLGISFSLKYVGFALAAKTFYGQTLESNLYDPYAAFGLTLSLMVVVTGMLLIASMLDRGQAIFQFPMDPVSLRRLSVICIGIGIGGYISFSSGVGADAHGGAAVVLGATLREFFYFGLIAEAIYAVVQTGGRSFVTRRLMFLLFVQAIISISFNERGSLVTCLIGIVSVAFLYNMLHIRHVIIGIILGSFFIFVFTPITLYLRLNRAGLSLTEFAELAGNTVTKAATDPDFFKLIYDSQKSAAAQEAMAVSEPYDYYGAHSEVLERLSYISLVDAVYNGTRTREPLGMAAIDQMLARIAPGFLVSDKESFNGIGPGDWLSWQTGLTEPGHVSFSVFALPMEGLATWGLIGLFAYPFIFMLPVIYVCGRLSSFQRPLPISIYLFVVIQHFMLDSSADVFVAWMTRSLPVNILILFALQHVLGSRAVAPRAGAV